MRGDNRDKSGINGDFLCAKGRYAFDFVDSEERLTQAAGAAGEGRAGGGELGERLRVAGKKLREIREKRAVARRSA